MKNNWEKIFYKKQFEWMDLQFDETSAAYFKQEADLILEQIGQPFRTVLELGSGRGDIANEIARQNKKVTTIELVEALCEYAEKHAHPNVQIICDDFYTVDLEEKFDAILYLDGFGVGSDEDQLFLLQRIYDWLSDDGYALIDIYQPLHWQKADGQEMYPFGSKDIQRKYSYDFENDRMLDIWWETKNPKNTVTQFLACYSPNEIYSLCEKAGLQVIGYFPGGAMDYENMTYKESASLEDCLSFRIKIKKKN